MTPRQTAKYIKGIQGIEDGEFFHTMVDNNQIVVHKINGKYLVERSVGYTMKEVERMNKEFQR